MSRQQRRPFNKSFVPGGTYNASPQVTPVKQPQQQQQYLAPQQQQQQQQQQQVQTPKPVAPPTPVVDPAPVQDDSMNDDSSVVDANGKPQFKKIFANRKKSSVRAKEKKIRQNRTLRKTIVPKNALMALNEVKGITVSDFVLNSNPGGGFTAIVTVNDNQYEGKGSSKVAAKNHACEKALRDFVISKMRQHPRIKKNSTSSDAMDTSENADAKSQAEDDEDDVPMVNLASFALYKLFSEWEGEGFVIPEMHANGSAPSAPPSENGAPAAAAKQPKPPKVRTELPPNWETMHPAMLLCHMRPGLSYVDFGPVGDKPNVMQKVGITVDHVDYFALGRNKKQARRNVAAAVCNQLYNTNFVKEEPMEATA